MYGVRDACAAYRITAYRSACAVYGAYRQRPRVYGVLGLTAQWAWRMSATHIVRAVYGALGLGAQWPDVWRLHRLRRVSQRGLTISADAERADAEALAGARRCGLAAGLGGDALSRRGVIGRRGRRRRRRLFWRGL